MKKRVSALRGWHGVSSSPVSEVIRQAIAAWANRQEPVTSPYEAMKDLIGNVPVV